MLEDVHWIRLKCLTKQHMISTILHVVYQLYLESIVARRKVEKIRHDKILRISKRNFLGPAMRT